MTEPTAHATTQCDGCGQYDDHPKEHIAINGATESYHYDCIPFRHQEMIANAAGDHDPSVKLSLIEKAKSGTRGEQLRAHILKTIKTPKG